jgi:hypothetical protein
MPDPWRNTEVEHILLLFKASNIAIYSAIKK